MADSVVFDFRRAFNLGSRLSQQYMDRWQNDPQFRASQLNFGGQKSQITSAGRAQERVYNGLVYQSGHLVPDVLYPLDDMKFADTATNWELQWSEVGDRGGWFTPVMLVTPFLQRMGMATVAAHYGIVYGNQLITTGGPVTYNKDGVLGGPGMVFVFKTGGSTAPPGWSIWGHGETNYEVLTTVDGQVLMVLGEHSFGFVEVETVTPLDLIFGFVALVEFVGMGAKLATVLIRKGMANFAARRVLAGPTRQLATALGGDELNMARTVKEVGLEKAMSTRGLRFVGYDRRIGIPQQHLQKMIEAARETNVVAVMRANKSVAIELIERGAVGKPKALSIPGFKSSPATGVLTASTPEQFDLVRKNGFFLMEADGVARRTIARGGQQIVEEKRLVPYWNVEPGQVIDPSGNPVVGDYDGLGAIPLESPGRNLALVPDDPIKGDWLGPDYKRFMEAVNPKLDKMRVLHGAQDQFPDIAHGGQYGGLTNELAYAVFPDGRVILLDGIEEQKKFYEAFGRQTMVGSYN